MAKVVLGMGTSHGPMLVTEPSVWSLRLPDDRRNQHPWRGRLWSYDELVEARAGDGLAEQITQPELQARATQCRKAVEEMARVFHEVRPDVAVIVGNDQMEIFDDGLIPAFSVLWGDEILNLEFSEARMAGLPPGIKESVPGYIPTGGATYRAAGELGRHIIETAIIDGFDVASMKRLPKNETPHAYGFVYRWIMRDDPAPSVPVVLNTFYPPNQPTVRRCYAFGQSLLHSIESWDSDARVAIIASGGLTHFVIDEEVDQIIFQALREGSVEPLAALGEEVFQAGTSEVKNWIPVAGAMAKLGFPMTLVDYVPVYRSLAGTGNAMGFVYWQPPA
jgi:hypothetical protein